LRRNKKALSEIVGYTLLIVIALAMAGMVFAFLKIYIPKESVACTDNINLIVQDYSCSASANSLNLTITNKGLFKADAAYIRLGNESQKIKTQINKDNIYFPGGLNPGESYNSQFGIIEIINGVNGTYVLEVQPAQVISNRLILCEKAIITQPIECN
jgi:hypothetical protein